MIGRGCREKIDRNRGVMTERKTDLAVFIGRLLNRIAIGHHKGADGRSVTQRKRMRVVVPGPEDCLEQKCSDAEERGHPASSL
jgi:hypothetical protein